MRNVYILLKYGLKRRKKKGYNLLRSFGSFSAILIPGAVFGFVLGVLFYKTFMSIPPIMVYNEYNMLDFIFGIWILMLSFLFIISYAPFISLNLFESNDTPFLLTLPIKKSSIFFASSIESLFMAGIPLFMLIPLPIIYSIAVHANPIYATLSTIFLIILILALSNILGVAVSFVISRTAAKFWGMSAYFVAVLFYFLIMYSPLAKTENSAQISYYIAKIKFLIGLIFSHYMFTNWLIKGIKGNILFMIIPFFFGIALIYITYKIGNYLDFSITRRKIRRELKIKKSPSSFPILKKNLKLIKRDPQVLYIIALTVIFPIILFYSSKNILVPFIVFLLYSPFYSALVTSKLFTKDINVMPLPLTLPLRKEILILSSPLLPSIIFTILYILLILFVDRANIALYILIPFVSLLFFSISCYSVYVLIRNPDRDYNKKNVFTLVESLGIEFGSLFISFLLIVGGYVTFSRLSKSNHPITTSLFLYLKNHPSYFNITLIAFIIGLILTIYLFIFSMNSFRKLSRNLE